ncbi:hypothetical protein MMC07_001635 [Pseudocyphellaria aurata]|nr:hypothetical protein [Pseudocyphellaria aurata]
MSQEPDENRGVSVLGISLVSLSIAVVFTILRMTSRIWILRKVWWDDYCIVVALVSARMLSITGSVFNVLDVRNQSERHQYYLTPHQISQVVERNIWYSIQNVLSLCLVKIAICLFILQIQAGRALRLAIWSVIVGLTVVNLSFVAVLVTRCRPLKAVWNPQVHGKCSPLKFVTGYGYFQGAFSCATDLFCALLPIHILKRVHIPLRTRVLICGLMSLGLFATVCNVLRTFYISKMTTEDYSWGSTAVITWAM